MYEYVGWIGSAWSHTPRIAQCDQPREPLSAQIGTCQWPMFCDWLLVPGTGPTWSHVHYPSPILLARSSANVARSTQRHKSGWSWLSITPTLPWLPSTNHPSPTTPSTNRALALPPRHSGLSATVAISRSLGPPSHPRQRSTNLLMTNALVDLMVTIIISHYHHYGYHFN